MGIIIGIDIGGSTTKIVGFDNNNLKIPTFVKANNPIASLFGAFGKFIYDNAIQLGDIEKIMITGVGSANVEQPLYGIPTFKVDEFTSNGLGGRYFTGLNDLIVVSMGTGTSFVQVNGDKIVHTGGIGIGGGTIIGLSSLLLKTQEISKIMELATGNVTGGTVLKCFGVFRLQDSGAETGEKGVVHTFLEGAEGVVGGLAQK